MDPLLVLLVVLAAVSVVLLGVLLARQTRHDPTAWSHALDALRSAQEQTEARLAAEVHRQRNDATSDARGLREEVASALKQAGDSIVRSVGEISGAQRLQLEAFAQQQGQLRTEVTSALRQFNDSIVTAMGQTSQNQSTQFEALIQQMQAALDRNQLRLEAVQQMVEGKLRELREDNTQQLERMRVTVDEKLHATLEQRLGETFRLVSDRLDAVHKGLGEMQSLAAGVGDLKRVLTNVKTRGTWGEIQLGALLEQVLVAEQYQANVCTKPNSAERVEFAIKLPGRSDDRDDVVWLPIDAKFPHEDYQRLMEAQELGDVDAVNDAGKKLEAQVKNCAKTIAEKYLNPPQTTDFAIMFVPTEGLYAEIVRRPGLLELMQRDHRIILAGPTTLAALLNSLQMGFRTLAVERRSSEVWALLGAVKSEFHKFGRVLERVQGKLHEASNTLDNATKQSRTIERKLRKVEELPSSDPHNGLLGVDVGDADMDELEQVPRLQQ